jgi:hypothetical protein
MTRRIDLNPPAAVHTVHSIYGPLTLLPGFIDAFLLLQRVVLQEMRRNKMSVVCLFLFSLGNNSKESGDQCGLPLYISFVHPLHLPFPDHVHHLVSLQYSPRRLE